MDVYSVSRTISPVSLGSTQGATRPHQFRAAMDAAAKSLGMEPSDLLKALKGGQSLADLAKTKGVSQDDLVKAMASAIGQANPSLSTDQATQIATRMATRVPGQAEGATGAGTANVGAAHGHHHHHGGGGNDVMSAVSNLLGETSSQVAAALQGGQSMVDLAKTKGVTKDDLVNAVATAFQKDNPNLSTEVATQIATQFATATQVSGSQVNVLA